MAEQKTGLISGLAEFTSKLKNMAAIQLIIPVLG